MALVVNRQLKNIQIRETDRELIGQAQRTRNTSVHCSENHFENEIIFSNCLHKRGLAHCKLLRCPSAVLHWPRGALISWNSGKKPPKICIKSIWQPFFSGPHRSDLANNYPQVADRLADVVEESIVKTTYDFGKGKIDRLSPLSSSTQMESSITSNSESEPRKASESPERYWNASYDQSTEENAH